MKSSVALITFTCLLLSACSAPLYVMRAAYEESKILLARQKIETVLKGPEASKDEKLKLTLVLQARAYAEKLGLKPGQSFTRFTRMEKDVISWVLMASRQDRFELHHWWFPIVGRVPYRGYFDQKEALDAGKKLSEQGYEIWVRGAEAFSTLGWFNDPVLSTTLKQSELRIANTILHESTHSTVWIPGNVPFNESLANFVGTYGVISFYQDRLDSCASAPAEVIEGCRQAMSAQVANAQRAWQQELRFAEVISRLYSSLAELYQSGQPSAEIIQRRAQIFDREVSPLRIENPGMKILQKINNAEIMQLKIYLTELNLYHQVFESCHSDWTCFLNQIQVVQHSIEKDSTQDPFKLLHVTLLAAAKGA